MTDAEKDRFAGSAGMPRRPLWNPELRAALARAGMTDAEKVARRLIAFEKREGSRATQAVAEAFEAALDPILTDLEAARSRVDEEQDRAMKLLTELAEAKAAFRSKNLYPISEMEQKLAAAEERAEQAEDERSVYRKHYFEQKERAESIALRMGARIQELELEQDNAGFIPWAGAQDVLNELTERAEKAERAHNRYEAAWKNSSRYWSARVQELEAALTDVKLDANERARADSIRIQELEAATRHLFAELDRGYGAAEAFGRLRRALLAGSEA